MRLAAATIGFAFLAFASAPMAGAQETAPGVTPPAAASQAAQDSAAGSPATAPTAAPGEPATEAPSDPAAPPEAAPSLGTPASEAPAGTDLPAGASEPAVEPMELNPALPHDLSPWGMFLAADWVVKTVMIGLVFASLVTWTVWLAKALELGLAKARARRQVRRLEEAGSLSAALADSGHPLRGGPVAALAQSAAAEAELSGALPAEGVKERASVALQRIEARSGRRMARGTGLLATIGSTAPFVGLFGTVWGIMNSFIGIAETNTTNLAIVAPGIAEALLATGIGLVAAIPAVIIYNLFARSIAGYRAILSDGSAAVLRHLSRDLDRRDAGLGAVPVRYAQPAE